MGPFSRAKAAGITWPYVAGLFDAVGHIRPNRPKLVFLEFSQKSYRFLEILETFLKAQLSLDSLSEFVSVRHFHRLSRLSVVDSSIAQTMLRQLLRVGLTLGSGPETLPLLDSYCALRKDVTAAQSQELAEGGRAARPFSVPL